eukprot:TRINITY_DN8635_c0_g1_i1.p1 TRINITY_DN8635_c0_g1~~TRINITY_DN8635_c0_g1_i1.p1  ORF type:complete len:353 (-),score=66.85 TRINITY_DN8635_c0_g1_i1:199-1224(-)
MASTPVLAPGDGPLCDGRAQLVGLVQQRLPNTICPVLLQACALHGINSSGQTISVDTGGIVALVDPPDIEGRVGTYKFFFFQWSRDDGDARSLAPGPLFEIDVGPRARLWRRSPAVVEFWAHGVAGYPDSYEVRFASEFATEAFMRDMTVRMRVMSLSMSNVRALRGREELRGELFEEWESTQHGKRCGCLCRLAWRIALLLVTLVVATVTLRVLVGTSETPLEIALATLQDVGAIAMTVAEVNRRLFAVVASAAAAAGATVQAEVSSSSFSFEADMQKCLNLEENGTGEAQQRPSSPLLCGIGDAASWYKSPSGSWLQTLFDYKSDAFTYVPAGAGSLGP